MVHNQTGVEPSEVSQDTIRLHDDWKPVQVIAHSQFQEEGIKTRSFLALRKRFLRPLCRQVFNTILR